MVKKIILLAAAVCLVMFMATVALAVNGETDAQPSQENAQMPQEEMNQAGRMPGGRGGMWGERPMPNGEMPQMPNGEFPGGERPQMTEGEMPQAPQKPIENAETSQSENGSEEQWQRPNGDMGFGGRGQFGGGFNEGETQNPAQEAGIEENVGFFKEYFTPTLSVVLLALAFIFVIFYKRKTY